MTTVAETLVSNLEDSLHELRGIIYSTKTIFDKKEDKNNIIQRLESYEDMVTKQLEILPGLLDDILNNRFNEVTLKVKKINAISTFIKDDAMEILGQKSNNDLKQ